MKMKVGGTVAAWGAHPLADHNEAVTVTLPPTLLHVYCCLQASYYHINYGNMDVERCNYRDSSFKMCARAARSGSLCWKHRWIVDAA